MSFFAQDLVWAGAELRPAAVPPAVPLTLRSAAADPSLLPIPSGQMIHREHRAGSNGRLILHIQDAHANHTAQKNIAASIDFWMERLPGMGLVAVEGGSGDGSLDRFKNAAPSKLWKRASAQLLRDGAITGEEYLNLTSDRPMRIWGIEDDELYERNRSVYAKVAASRARLKATLHRLRAALDTLKLRRYPQPLLDYEAALKKAGSGVWEYTVRSEALLLLPEASRPERGKYPVWDEWQDLRADEGRADLARLQAEMDLVAAALAADHPALAALKAAPSSDPVSVSAAWTSVILAAAQLSGSAARPGPELRRYLDRLNRAAELDVEALADEADRIEESAYAELLKDPGLVRLRESDRYLELLERAAVLRLDGRQTDRLRSGMREFPSRHWIAWINRELMEAGAPQHWVGYDREADRALRQVRRFYELVARRDEAFVRNLDEAMTRSGDTAAFLIAGGYHSSNVTRLLRKMGYSYAVYAPATDEETDWDLYEKNLLMPVPGSAGPEGARSGGPGGLAGSAGDIRQPFAAKMLGARMTSTPRPAYRELMRHLSGPAARASDDAPLSNPVLEELISDSAAWHPLEGEFISQVYRIVTPRGVYYAKTAADSRTQGVQELMRLLSDAGGRGRGGLTQAEWLLIHEQRIFRYALSHPSYRQALGHLPEPVLLNAGEQKRLSEHVTKTFPDRRGGERWIVTRAVTGANLQDMMDDVLPPLGPESDAVTRANRLSMIRRIMIRISTAVVRLNRVGLTHRDIKPDQIVLEPGWRVRLVDLGGAESVTVGSLSGEETLRRGFRRLTNSLIFQVRQFLRKEQLDADTAGLIGTYWMLLVQSRLPDSLPELMTLFGRVRTAEDFRRVLIMEEKRFRASRAALRRAVSGSRMASNAEDFLDHIGRYVRVTYWEYAETEEGQETLLPDRVQEVVFVKDLEEKPYWRGLRRIEVMTVKGRKLDFVSGVPAQELASKLDPSSPDILGLESIEPWNETHKWPRLHRDAVDRAVEMALWKYDEVKPKKLERAIRGFLSGSSSLRKSVMEAFAALLEESEDNPLPAEFHYDPLQPYLSGFDHQERRIALHLARRQIALAYVSARYGLGPTSRVMIGNYLPAGQGASRSGYGEVQQNLIWAMISERRQAAVSGADGPAESAATDAETVRHDADDALHELEAIWELSDPFGARMASRTDGDLPRLLVLDDRQIHHRRVSDAYGPDHRIDHAFTVREAVRMVRQAEQSGHPYRLVISDLDLAPTIWGKFIPEKIDEPELRARSFRRSAGLLFVRWLLAREGPVGSARTRVILNSTIFEPSGWDPWLARLTGSSPDRIRRSVDRFWQDQLRARPDGTVPELVVQSKSATFRRRPSRRIREEVTPVPADDREVWGRALETAEALNTDAESDPARPGRVRIVVFTEGDDNEREWKMVTGVDVFHRPGSNHWQMAKRTAPADQDGSYLAASLYYLPTVRVQNISGEWEEKPILMMDVISAALRRSDTYASDRVRAAEHLKRFLILAASRIHEQTGLSVWLHPALLEDEPDYRRMLQALSVRAAERGGIYAERQAVFPWPQGGEGGEAASALLIPMDAAVLIDPLQLRSTGTGVSSESAARMAGPAVDEFIRNALDRLEPLTSRYVRVLALRSGQSRDMTLRNAIRTFWDRFESIPLREPGGWDAAMDLLTESTFRTSSFLKWHEGRPHPIYRDIRDRLRSAIRSAIEAAARAQDGAAPVVRVAIAGPGFMQEPIEVRMIFDRLVDEMGYPEGSPRPRLRITVIDRPGSTDGEFGAAMERAIRENTILYDPDDVRTLVSRGLLGSGTEAPEDVYFDREPNGYRLKPGIHREFELVFTDLASEAGLSELDGLTGTQDLVLVNNSLTYLPTHARVGAFERLADLLGAGGSMILTESGLGRSKFLSGLRERNERLWAGLEFLFDAQNASYGYLYTRDSGGHVRPDVVPADGARMAVDTGLEDDRGWGIPTADDEFRSFFGSGAEAVLALASGAPDASVSGLTVKAWKMSAPVAAFDLLGRGTHSMADPGDFHWVRYTHRMELTWIRPDGTESDSVLYVKYIGDPYGVPISGASASQWAGNPGLSLDREYHHMSLAHEAGLAPGVLMVNGRLVTAASSGREVADELKALNWTGLNDAEGYSRLAARTGSALGSLHAIHRLSPYEGEYEYLLHEDLMWMQGGEPVGIKDHIRYPENGPAEFIDLGSSMFKSDRSRQIERDYMKYILLDLLPPHERPGAGEAFDRAYQESFGRPRRVPGPFDGLAQGARMADQKDNLIDAVWGGALRWIGRLRNQGQEEADLYFVRTIDEMAKRTVRRESGRSSSPDLLLASLAFAPPGLDPADGEAPVGEPVGYALSFNERHPSVYAATISEADLQRTWTRAESGLRKQSVPFTKFKSPTFDRNYLEEYQAAGPGNPGIFWKKPLAHSAASLTHSVSVLMDIRPGVSVSNEPAIVVEIVPDAMLSGSDRLRLYEWAARYLDRILSRSRAVSGGQWPVVRMIPYDSIVRIVDMLPARELEPMGGARRVLDNYVAGDALKDWIFGGPRGARMASEPLIDLKHRTAQSDPALAAKLLERVEVFRGLKPAARTDASSGEDGRYALQAIFMERFGKDLAAPMSPYERELFEFFVSRPEIPLHFHADGFGSRDLGSFSYQDENGRRWRDPGVGVYEPGAERVSWVLDSEYAEVLTPEASYRMMLHEMSHVYDGLNEMASIDARIMSGELDPQKAFGPYTGYLGPDRGFQGGPAIRHRLGYREFKANLWSMDGDAGAAYDRTLRTYPNLMEQTIQPLLDFDPAYPRDEIYLILKRLSEDPASDRHLSMDREEDLALLWNAAAQARRELGRPERTPTTAAGARMAATKPEQDRQAMVLLKQQLVGLDPEVVRRLRPVRDIGELKASLSAEGVTAAAQLRGKFLFEAWEDWLEQLGPEPAPVKRVTHLRYEGNGRHLIAYSAEDFPYVLKMNQDPGLKRFVRLEWIENGLWLARERLGGLAAPTMAIDAESNEGQKPFVYLLERAGEQTTDVAIVQKKVVPLIDHLKELVRSDRLEEAKRRMDEYKRLTVDMFRRGVVDTDFGGILANYGVDEETGKLVVFDFGDLAGGITNAYELTDFLDNVTNAYIESGLRGEVDDELADYFRENAFTAADFTEDGRYLFESDLSVLSPEELRMDFPLDEKEVREYFSHHRIADRSAGARMADDEAAVERAVDWIWSPEQEERLGRFRELVMKYRDLPGMGRYLVRLDPMGPEAGQEGLIDGVVGELVAADRLAVENPGTVLVDINYVTDVNGSGSREVDAVFWSDRDMDKGLKHGVNFVEVKTTRNAPRKTIDKALAQVLEIFEHTHQFRMQGLVTRYLVAVYIPSNRTDPSEVHLLKRQDDLHAIDAWYAAGPLFGSAAEPGAGPFAARPSEELKRAWALQVRSGAGEALRDRVRSLIVERDPALTDLMRHAIALRDFLSRVRDIQPQFNGGLQYRALLSAVERLDEERQNFPVRWKRWAAEMMTQAYLRVANDQMKLLRSGRADHETRRAAHRTLIEISERLAKTKFAFHERIILEIRDVLRDHPAPKTPADPDRASAEHERREALPPDEDHPKQWEQAVAFARHAQERGETDRALRLLDRAQSLLFIKYDAAKDRKKGAKEIARLRDEVLAPKPDGSGAPGADPAAARMAQSADLRVTADDLANNAREITRRISDQVSEGKRVVIDMGPGYLVERVVESTGMGRKAWVLRALRPDGSLGERSFLKWTDPTLIFFGVPDPMPARVALGLMRSDPIAQSMVAGFVEDEARIKGRGGLMDFIHTRFVEGELFSEIEDPVRRVRVLVRLARNLAYLEQEYGFVHGDLHDRNIFVDASDEPILVDFDMTRNVIRRDREKGVRRPFEYRDIFEIGDLILQSYSEHGSDLPELFTGDLLTLQPEIHIEDWRGKTRPPDLAKVPEGLQRIVQKALLADPAAHYDRMSELQADLERYLGDDPTSLAGARMALESRGRDRIGKVYSATSSLVRRLSAFLDAEETPARRRLARQFPEVEGYFAQSPEGMNYDGQPVGAGGERNASLYHHVVVRGLGQKLAGLESGDIGLFQGAGTPEDRGINAGRFERLVELTRRLKDAGVLPHLRAAFLHHEAGKGGSSAQRAAWSSVPGMDLRIPNRASGLILRSVDVPGGEAKGFFENIGYLDRTPNAAVLHEFFYRVIENRGSAGQWVRGELSYAAFEELTAWIRENFGSLSEAVGAAGDADEAARRIVGILHLFEVLDVASLRDGLYAEPLAAEMEAVFADWTAVITPKDGKFGTDWSDLFEARWGGLGSDEDRRAYLKDRLGRFRRERRSAGESQEDLDRVLSAPSLSAAAAERFTADLRNFQGWYPESAMYGLSPEAMVKLIALAIAHAERAGVDTDRPYHLHFFEFMKFLSSGRHQFDPYKVRIVETLLKGFDLNLILTDPEAALSSGAQEGQESPLGAVRMDLSGQKAISFEFHMSDEAEALLRLIRIYELKSGPKYHQALKMLLDLYGLRRDEFDRVANETVYLQGMRAAASDKARLLSHGKGPVWVDIGPADGATLEIAESLKAEKGLERIVGVEISEEAFRHLQGVIRSKGLSAEAVRGDAGRLKEVLWMAGVPEPDTIIFSSVLHEVFSYAAPYGGRYDLESVKDVLRAATLALAPGGRILIRDGVVPEDGDKDQLLEITGRESKEVFDYFVQNFEARERYFEGSARPAWKDNFTVVEEDAQRQVWKVRMPRKAAMEFLFKLSWAFKPEYDASGLPSEIREQYGVMKRSEYLRVIGELAGELGMSVREVELPDAERVYLQQGYVDTLKGKAQLFDLDGSPAPFGPSNMMIVVEKVPTLAAPLSGARMADGAFAGRPIYRPFGAVSMAEGRVLATAAQTARRNGMRGPAPVLLRSEDGARMAYTMVPEDAAVSPAAADPTVTGTAISPGTPAATDEHVGRPLDIAAKISDKYDRILSLLERAGLMPSTAVSAPTVADTTVEVVVTLAAKDLNETDAERWREATREQLTSVRKRLAGKGIRLAVNPGLSEKGLAEILGSEYAPDPKMAERRIYVRTPDARGDRDVLNFYMEPSGYADGTFRAAPLAETALVAAAVVRTQVGRSLWQDDVLAGILPAWGLLSDGQPDRDTAYTILIGLASPETNAAYAAKAWVIGARLADLIEVLRLGARMALIAA